MARYHMTQESSVSDAQQELAEFSQTIFTDLQHDFHELNHEIAKDSPLEPFRHEYAKLFGILQKSMTNQARYIDKCRGLESEIVGNKAKVRTVSKLSEEDSKSIANLNDDRDKKQAILNENQGILREVMEENASVSSEIAALESALEECVANERGQKDHLKQLKGRRTELIKEHEDLGFLIPQLQEANKAARDRLEAKERSIDEAQNQLKRIEELLEAKHKEGQNEQQRLFNLEKDREATRLRLKDVQQTLKERLAEVNQEQEAVKQLERKVKDQKKKFDSVRQERQDVSDKCTKVQKDLDILNQAITEIEDNMGTNSKLLEEQRNVGKQLQKQVQGKEGENEKMRGKCDELRDKYQMLRKDKDGVKNKIDGAEANIERLRREGESVRRETDALAREENKQLKRKEGEQQHQVEHQRILESYHGQAYNIECETSISKGHLQEIQKKIYAVENERERYSQELSTATSQYLHAQDVLKEIEAKIAVKNKEIMDGEKKLRQQQSLYEQVLGERLIASKKKRDMETEINKLNEMLKDAKKDIAKRKEDIKSKEAELKRQEEAFVDVDKSNQLKVQKLAKLKEEVKHAQSALVAGEGEISKLEQTVKDAETQLRKDEQKLDTVKQERDNMSNQNVEKERELQEMHSKLEVLRKQCYRGEVEYDTKEAEISRLQAKIEERQQEIKNLSAIGQEVEERRKEIHSKQKALMQLRAERTAMEEELKVPINIHRWTLLESSDPVRFDKLKRYQELQANLVEKTKQVSDLQDLIKEKESLYMELSAQVRRKPGLEVGQRMNEYKSRCKTGKFDLEEITTQLEMYRNAVKEYRTELAGMQSELVSERDKWIRQKKRDLKYRQELQAQKEALDELGIDINLS